MPSASFSVFALLFCSFVNFLQMAEILLKWLWIRCPITVSVAHHCTSCHEDYNFYSNGCNPKTLGPNLRAVCSGFRDPLVTLRVLYRPLKLQYSSLLFENVLRFFMRHLKLRNTGGPELVQSERVMNFYQILSGWLWCHVLQVTGLLDILTTAFSSPPTENDAGRLWLRVRFFFHLDVLLQCILPLINQLFIFLPEGLSHITVIIFTNVCFFIDGSLMSWFSLKFRHLRPLLWHLQIFCAQFSGQLVTLYLPGKSASLSYVSNYKRKHHIIFFSHIVESDAGVIVYWCCLVVINRLSLLLQALLTKMSPVVCGHLQVCLLHLLLPWEACSQLYLYLYIYISIWIYWLIVFAFVFVFG